MLAWLATLKSLFDALTMFFTWRARAEEINARTLVYDTRIKIQKENDESQKKSDELFKDDPAAAERLDNEQLCRSLYLADISNVIPSSAGGNNDSNQAGAVQGAKG